MKIANRFLSSSIGLCTIIVLLVGGTNFWVHFQEEQFEEKKEEIQETREDILQLEVLFDRQIDSLKDFLVLNQDPAKITQYQTAKATFLETVNKLETEFPQNKMLFLLDKHYRDFQIVSDNLFALSETNLTIEQDIENINSFRHDISLYLQSLNQETQSKLSLIEDQEEASSSLLTYAVWVLIVLIALLMFIQYRLVVSPVVDSLGQLTLGVKRVSAGDFQYRLTLKGSNEITNVAQDFNQMTDILEGLYEDLEHKVEERTAQLATINENLKSEIIKREVVEGELRKIFEDTRRSQQLLLSIINATPDWIFVKDIDFRFVLVNESFARHFATTPDQIIGKNISDLNVVIKGLSVNKMKDLEIILTEDQAVLEGKDVHNPSDYVTDLEGITSIFDTRKMPLQNEQGQIIGILGVSRDITERHRAQKALQKSEAQLRQKAEELEETLTQLQRTQLQIIQSEKMSSLGQMVAGVAHEINNPVNFIFGNITHAKEYVKDLIKLLKLYQTEYPEPKETIQEEIEAIELDYLLEDMPNLLNSMTVGAERIRDIVKSLRTFSRLDEAEMKNIDIHDGIDSTLMILHNRLKEKQDHPAIKVVKNYGELPQVDCYAGQLNQVFMNLLSNAIDVLDECDAKRNSADTNREPSQITITTTKLASVPGMKEWVSIKIKDNGSGIPDDIQQKLFEPFFTTKDVGKGTGLGLSIAHAIVVEKHGGQLSCYSKVGEGTEFTIEIPITA